MVRKPNYTDEEVISGIIEDMTNDWLTNRRQLIFPTNKQIMTRFNCARDRASKLNQGAQERVMNWALFMMPAISYLYGLTPNKMMETLLQREKTPPVREMQNNELKAQLCLIDSAPLFHDLVFNDFALDGKPMTRDELRYFLREIKDLGETVTKRDIDALRDEIANTLRPAKKIAHKIRTENHLDTKES